MPERPSCLVIAVDGTSGSGKSSTSRGVAQALGLRYLDTGAQFRAVTWWMLQKHVDVRDAGAVAALAEAPALDSGIDPDHPTIAVDGVDVSGPIRSLEVTQAVSLVSVVPAVRTRLLNLQRRIISEALREADGIVVEGRDIGSVVWPQAEVKVYLTAEADARAERRAAEHAHLGDAESAKATLLERDAIDSTRQHAPLVQADGAVHVDTTGHTLDEVVAYVVGLARAAAGTAEGAEA